MGELAIGAASAMIPLLKDEIVDVRGKTAWALGRLGDDSAVEPLISALLDKDAGVRSAAASSLNQLTGEKFGDDHAKWREWFEGHR